jgi:hypothetical protein
MGDPLTAFPELTLREGLDEESNFILNSWLMSYKHVRCGTYDERLAASGAMFAGRAMDSGRYFKGQQALVSALAARSRVLSVCDAQDPSFVVGWACGALQGPSEASQELVVHYVYVKHAYRKHGVALELLKGLGWKPGMTILATHWTKPCATKAIKYNIVFDDYPLTVGAA